MTRDQMISHFALGGYEPTCYRDGMWYVLWRESDALVWNGERRFFVRVGDHSWGNTNSTRAEFHNRTWDAIPTEVLSKMWDHQDELPRERNP